MGKIEAIGVLGVEGGAAWCWHARGPAGGVGEGVPPEGFFRGLWPRWGAGRSGGLAAPQQAQASPEPIVRLDRDWEAAWLREGDAIVVAVMRVGADRIEVVSDDEEEDDEDAENDVAGAQGDSESDPAAGSLATPPTPSNVWLSSNENPLGPLQFLDYVISAIEAKCPLTRNALTLNAHKVAMILQEMLAGGLPFVVEAADLRESLPSHSLMSAVKGAVRGGVSAATAAMGKGSGTATGSGGQAGALYVDLVEDLHLTTMAGAPTAATVRGSLRADNALGALQGPLAISLAGVPTLGENFNGGVSLHRTVDRARWASRSARQLCATPPQGKTMLLEYVVDALAGVDEANGISQYLGAGSLSQLGPVRIALQTNLTPPMGSGRNGFQITVSTTFAQGATALDTIAVVLALPADCDVRVHFCSSGVVAKDVRGTWRWELEENLPLGGEWVLRGVVEEIGDGALVGVTATGATGAAGANGQNGSSSSSGPFGAHVSAYGAEGTNGGTRAHVTGPGSDHGRSNPHTNSHSTGSARPLYLTATYSFTGALFSGIRVEDIHIPSSGSPFKGVKYTSQGTIVVA